MEIVISACRVSAAKCFGMMAVIILNVTFGNVDLAVIMGAIILTAFDFMTAMMADKKEGKKTVLALRKFVVYPIMISSGYIAESIIQLNTGADIPIASVIAITIALHELVSIMRNVDGMGFVIPKKLKKFLEIKEKDL